MVLFGRKIKNEYFSNILWYYFIAIRSGDYYMFDDLDDEELDLIAEKEDDEAEDDLVLKKKSTTVGEVINNI